MNVRILCGAACVVSLLSASWCVASNPLVTGDLTAYYSFDEVDEDGIFLDGSGNNLHGLITLGFEDANEDDLDDIRIDFEDKVRGAGSVRFDTDAEIKEDYIAVCDPINQPDHNDGCGEPLEDRPSYVPADGFTIAAWVKADDVGQDQSVWQSRAGGGGFIHNQIQNGGNIRFRLRGDLNGDNIVAFNEAPDGEPVAFEEWIHYAGTYEKGDDPEGFGEFAIFYNGVEVLRDEGNGNVNGTEADTLGDWAMGAFIGLVPDMNRQLVGSMDEFYLFSRALTAAEITTLYENKSSLLGDYNGNGLLDAEDLDLNASVGIASQDLSYDLNEDGGGNSTDRKIWVNDLKNTWVGDSDLNGVFDSGDLVAVFSSAKYETGDAATWGQGDWNGDQKFDSGDLVEAFSNAGYEAGERPGGANPAAAVPEPSTLVLLLMGGLLAIRRVRR